MRKRGKASQRPRVLLWDVENSHNLAAVFQLLNKEPIHHDNIIQEKALICAAWKWRGEKRVYAAAVKTPGDDKALCQTLSKVLQQADVIVAHNGDWFDKRLVAGRMLFHNLPPLPPIPSIDTLKVARSKFLLNCNRLDYLGKYLKVGRKKSTPQGLWLRVLQGDKKAIREMVAYNKQDVVLLEAVFEKLAPYIPDHLNRQIFGLDGCPRCGSQNVQKRGLHRTLTTTYTRFQCQSCGGWHRSRKAERSRVASRLL